jgi:protease IV
MWQFVKYVLATIIGLFLFAFLGLIVLGGIAASAGKEQKPAIESNSILKLELNYHIPEKSENGPFSNFDFSTFKSKKAIGLYDIGVAIKQAAHDDKIKGIYIQMGSCPNGMATIDAVKGYLTEFKKSGKFIYAYGDIASQKSYYLATVADQIMLNPSGGMEMIGFGREIMYYKNALEKLGIEVQDFHCGAFKSAIEPYLRDKMSDANREQLTVLYGDVFGRFLQDIATARHTDTATIHAAINSLQAMSPLDAQAHHFIDQVGYYDQVVTILKDKVGIKKKDDLNLISLTKYASSIDPNTDGSKIAVVCADGEIVDNGGSSNDGVVGHEFAETIRKAREDEKVKAIVLRVNSPGGSVLASDLMWRELLLARKAKPLIVSFGDVAASGGYYIACMGDRIFAQPNTITGSIGVYGLIPNAKKLLNDKLGITTDQVKVTRHGALTIGTNQLDEEERSMIQSNIDRVYREFKSKVAEGRKKDTAYIETIAQGRVWTGAQALHNGLIDEIGTLETAVAYAAKQANVKSYHIKMYPESKSLGEQLAESLGDAKQQMIRQEIGDDAYHTLATLRSLGQHTGLMMRMPMELW